MKNILLILIILLTITCTIQEMTTDTIKHSTNHIYPNFYSTIAQDHSDKPLKPNWTCVLECSALHGVISGSRRYNFSSGDYVALGYYYEVDGWYSDEYEIRIEFGNPNDGERDRAKLISLYAEWDTAYLKAWVDNILRIEAYLDPNNLYDSGEKFGDAYLYRKYIHHNRILKNYWNYSGSFSKHTVKWEHKDGYGLYVKAIIKCIEGVDDAILSLDDKPYITVRYSYIEGSGGNPPPSKKYVLNVKSKPINVKISYEIDGKSYSKTTPFSIERDRPFTVKLIAPQYYSGYSFSYWDADHIYTSRTITLNILRSMTATAVYYKQNSPPKYLIYIRSNPISGVRYLYANPTYPWQNPGWQIGYTPDARRPGENRWKDVWVKLSVPLYWYSNQWYKFKKWTIYTGIWTVWKTYTNVNITFDMKGRRRLIAYAYYEPAVTHRLTLKVMYLDYLYNPVDIVKNYPIEIDGTTYYTNSSGDISIITRDGSHRIYVYDMDGGDTYHYFYRYSDGSTSNPRTIMLDGDKTYTIYLVRKHRVKITYTVGGCVLLNDETISNSTIKWYKYGEPISLQAIPYTRYSFKEWLQNNYHYSSSKFIMWQVVNPAEWKAVFVKKRVKLTYLGSNWYLMHEGLNVSLPYDGYYNISIRYFYVNATPVYHLLTNPTTFEDIYYSGNLTIYTPAPLIHKGEIVNLPNPNIPRVVGGAYDRYYWLGICVGNPFSHNDISGFNDARNITYNIYNISEIFYNSSYSEEFRQTIVISAYNLSLHAHYDRYGVNITLISEWRYKPPSDLNIPISYHKVDIALVCWDKREKILFKKPLGDYVLNGKLYTTVYLLHQDLTDRYWTYGSKLTIDYRWLSPTGKSLQFRPYGTTVLNTELICMVPYIIGNVSENPVIVHYWINPWLINRVKVIAVLWDNRKYSWIFDRNDFTITINVDKTFKDIYWYFIPCDTDGFLLYVPPIKW